MPSKTRICKFQKQGKCTRGEDCVYAHDREEQRGARAANCLPKICKFYGRNLCKYGAACPKRHVEPTEEGTQIVREIFEAGTVALEIAVKVEVAEESQPTILTSLASRDSSAFDIDISQMVDDVASCRVKMRLPSWADMKDDSEEDVHDAPVQVASTSTSVCSTVQSKAPRRAWADMFDDSDEEA